MAETTIPRPTSAISRPVSESLLNEKVGTRLNAAHFARSYIVAIDGTDRSTVGPLSLEPPR